MGKMTGFLIGIVLVTIVVTSLGIFTANLGGNYAKSDQSTIYSSYDKLDEMHTRSIQLKENVTTIKEKSGILDIVGAYFSSAYQVLILTQDSYDTYDTMSEEALSQAKLGEIGSLLRVGISAIILIIIGIGVFLSAIMKWDI